MPSDPVYAKAYYDKQQSAQRPEYSRTCHDCGTPTNDYRCPDCWRRLRAKHGVCFDISDAPSYSSTRSDFLRDDIDDLP